DTVVFSGKASEYQLLYTQGGVFITDLNEANGDDGFDTLFNVEHAKFLDKTIGLGAEPIVVGVVGGDQTGFSVAAAGDVNHDGFGDFIVGGPLADGDDIATGAAYVVFGDAAGLPGVLDLASLDGTNGFRLAGAAVADYAGISVASAGDLN